MRHSRLRRPTIFVCALLIVGLQAVTSCYSASPAALDYLELTLLGRQYKSEPLPIRISRLEQVSSGHSNAAEPLDFRMARLMASAEAYRKQQLHNDAVQAYNQGVDAMNQGVYPEALKHFQEAARLDTGMLQAYNNLATVYEKMAQPEDAIQAMQNAIRIAPRDPVLYRNLGILLEKSGKMEQAMAAYQTYLKLAPSDSDPAISSIVQALRQNSRREPDYYPIVTSATDGKLLAWPKNAQPIPVYVQLSNPDQAPYLPLLHETFRVWEQATGSGVSFVEVPESRKARILIQLRPGPLAHPEMEVGHAKYVIENPNHPYQSLTVTITVNTGERNHQEPTPPQREQVRRIMLHELGHAIGLWGHSPNPTDVMYTHPLVSNLSSRDVQTVRKLYENPTQFAQPRYPRFTIPGERPSSKAGN
ncbi:MAG TPA: tetratricopeptide repeat protein [Coleofasciculaceae cyanobacterium]|jgi:predicted Zn-dependent protease